LLRKNGITAKRAKHAKLRKDFSLVNLRALGGLGGRNRVSPQKLATGFAVLKSRRPVWAAAFLWEYLRNYYTQVNLRSGVPYLPGRDQERGGRPN
jgi:hypothetical protein